MDMPKTTFKKARFSKFYKSHMFTDCTFIVDGIELKLHRFIMACSSQVFEKMLFGELSSDVIDISDITLEDFIEVLDFIYLNRLQLTSISHAWKLFIIANRFFIEDLIDNCLAYISKKFGINDVLMCYEFAEMFNLSELKEKCYEDMVNYFQAALITDYHMKPTTFSAVIGKFKPKVDLFDLAIKIIDWAMTECELRELPLQSANVLEILREVNASQCLGKEWGNVKTCIDCEKELVFCECFDEVMHKTIMNLHKIFDRDYKDFPSVLRKKFYWTNIPEKCKSKDEFKIATRIDLTNKEEFVSRLVSDHRTLALGVLIVAPMKPENAKDLFFNGTVVLRICEQFQNVDLCKPSKLTDNIFYNCYIYIPLREIFTLEPHKTYDFRISYKTCDNSGVSVPSYYFSSTLKNDNITITFHDDFGSVVKGLAFCRA